MSQRKKDVYLIYKKHIKVLRSLRNVSYFSRILTKFRVHRQILVRIKDIKFTQIGNLEVTLFLFDVRTEKHDEVKSCFLQLFANAPEAHVNLMFGCFYDNFYKVSFQDRGY
jgi:hypothetical protein